MNHNVALYVFLFSLGLNYDVMSVNESSSIVSRLFATADFFFPLTISVVDFCFRTSRVTSETLKALSARSEVRLMFDFAVWLSSNAIN